MITDKERKKALPENCDVIPFQDCENCETGCNHPKCNDNCGPCAIEGRCEFFRD